ncbi:MAG TPA: type IV secretory system conjugative DNA transfer family protein [Streptosporangiaceae bacterium]|nr:type IV secretory system conjugative DNA transfer family protein [Streptosporangiaceae bacterium]
MLALVGVAAGLLVAVITVRVAFSKEKLPRYRVRQMRLRARLRLRPGPGMATLFELWLRWGRVAAARRAARSRPSLSRADRWWCPWLTSVLVGRAQFGHACRVPVEEHVIYIAPPRAGKTGALADVIAHHPGAVVATTTRGDLHALTAGIRAGRGPVHVFNPQGLADVASTMRWDMLAGCQDPATAIRRAQPLAAIGAFKGEGEEFWASATTLWLQTLLHVAALRGASMDMVHYWALQPAPADFHCSRSPKACSSSIRTSMTAAERRSPLSGTGWGSCPRR